uniref:NADH-ubiquinone oxidoreductase chain 5 n=1 Tax=Cercodemas anceps TaxID=2785214 RepID=A0A7S8FIE1_9ECHN|nr:NADH dehydrogenase subunit 5 [Cercodemas anceps]QPD06745.1 NADH dehydrogenase subunit 5 [Cercodemas anceps]
MLCFNETILHIGLNIILFLLIHNINNDNNNEIIEVLNFLSILSVSILPLTTYSSNIKNIHFNLDQLSISAQADSIYDISGILVTLVAVIVTSSIARFSIYYMSNDLNLNMFLRLLLIFLINMILITSTSNIHVFFTGWEGVGILSFILINWWDTRNNANSAAIQAIIYNRIGDIGLLVMVTGISSISGWNLTSLKIIENNSELANIILFSSLFAAMGKSAQFSLHPWLPAAMEGPTPVSALLHSSTMVVAGIFLLIRVTEHLSSNIFNLFCTTIGSLTAIFAATSAIYQHDIKKIIAYSTTSQLGLMMIAIGLGNPNIALFHICTHAFFKAMLFLCSGSIIHSFNNEQDLRKLSNIKISLPITSACLFLGSIALMGIPFLSGFFSKDIILESITNTPNNIIIFILASTATFLTASYSFRIINICFCNNPNQLPLLPINEENKNLTKPIINLAWGTIISGWLLSNWIIEIPPLFPSTLTKNTPIFITILGTILASTIIFYANNNLLTFFSKSWFFQQITHSTINNIISIVALQLTTQNLDRGWNNALGAQGISNTINKASQNIQITQTGNIKRYLLATFFLIFSILIIIITV